MGYERIEETQNPEKSIDRAMENYLKLGYSKEWINQRLKRNWNKALPVSFTKRDREHFNNNRFP